MREVRQGLGLAFLVVPVQIFLARILEFVPGGTRAQATGACLASLTILGAGLALGLFTQRKNTLRALRTAIELERTELARMRDLQRDAVPFGTAAAQVARSPAVMIATLIEEEVESIPWGGVMALTFALAVFGIIGFNTSAGAQVLPESTLAVGGIARAMFATDAIVIPSLILILLGTMLGLAARPWTLLTALLGFGLLAALSIGGETIAEYASYDPDVVRIYTLIALVIAGLLTGFAISWARRRLAFVEQFLVALLAGYVIYLVAAVGPRELIAASNIPEEQVLLALVLAPVMSFLVLLTVGGSIGFLLLGGGRFDAGFRYEALVAMRQLKGLRMGLTEVLILIPGLLLGPLLGPVFLMLILWKRSSTLVVTLISVLGVATGVMALIVVLSVMSGFEDDLKQKILGAHAHIVLGKHGDDFSEYGEVEKRVREVEGVNTAAAFILADAMISSDVGLSGTLVKGIDPADKDASQELRKNIEDPEKRKAGARGSLDHLITPEQIPGARPRVVFRSSTSTGAASSTTSKALDPFGLGEPALRETLEGTGRDGLASAGGTALPGRDPMGGGKTLPGIVIGLELSRTLRAAVGDVVKLVSPVSDEIGPTGPHPKLRRFRVAGIFYSGMYEYDAKFTYIDMKQAQSFFAMHNKVTGVELRVADVDDTGHIVEELKRLLGGFPYTVKDWRTMNKELFSALLLEKLAMFIILTFIILVAACNIVATLIMIVLEKGKEIAIMKSLGSSDASIMKIFVIHGLIVGVSGALLGFGAGVGICSLIQKYGIELDQKIFYIEKLPVVMSWMEISLIAVAAVVISYLATIFPAMTAARLRPVEGLRDD